VSQVKWVLPKKFSDLTGYTEEAIRHKMKDGTWPQGRVWKKGPDGRLLINVQEYDKWIDLDGRAA
jgi:hypothetical protein